MTLTPEQKQAVASWVSAGDNLSIIQQRLSEQFKISLTYMDVRFLVDDLGLELKSPAAPRVDANADLGPARPAQSAVPEKKGGLLDKLKKAVGGGGAGAGETAASELPPEADLPENDLDESLDALPPGGSRVKVVLDRVVRPGAMVSGSVTFSDGTSGKWAMDQYGRLMLDPGKKGYQPPAADIEGFQRELSRQLQRHGL
jgi:hypothetical protein